jgi:hypothetical protein
MSYFKNGRAEQHDQKFMVVAGELSFADLDASDNVISAFRTVGSVNTFDISSTPTKISKKETMSGLNSKVSEIVTDIEHTVSFDFAEFSPENFADFIYGTLINSASATALTKNITAGLGLVSPIGDIFEANTAVTVEDELQTVVYELGKNYEMTSSAIYVYTAAEQTAKGAVNSITSAEVLVVTYDKVEESVIEAFTKTQLNKAMRFEGVDKAQGNKPIIVEFYKASIDPTAFGLLSPEDYSSATGSATLLVPSGKTNPYSIKMAK